MIKLQLFIAVTFILYLFAYWYAKMVPYSRFKLIESLRELDLRSQFRAIDMSKLKLFCLCFGLLQKYFLKMLQNLLF